MARSRTRRCDGRAALLAPSLGRFFAVELRPHNFLASRQLPHLRPRASPSTTDSMVRGSWSDLSILWHCQRATALDTASPRNQSSSGTDRRPGVQFGPGQPLRTWGAASRLPRRRRSRTGRQTLHSLGQFWGHTTVSGPGSRQESFVRPGSRGW
jgi:hypothetical protein